MKTRCCFLAVFLFLLATGGQGAILYVNLNSSNPTPPYSTWATAATNIQDAIDASSDGDQILATNGVYQTGAGRVVHGTVTNRVAVTKAVNLLSVNGAAATIINGNGLRCVYLTNNAMLAGFTLSNGTANGTGTSIYDTYGGGVWCESPVSLVSNCVLTGNSAYNGGGAAYRGNLSFCIISNNSSANGIQGGGTSECILSHCTLVKNTSLYGGGAYGGILDGCLLANNLAGYGGAANSAFLTNCLIINNSAADGGGLDNSTAINCEVLTNSVSDMNEGGGAISSTLINCTIVGNYSSDGPGVALGGGTFGCNETNCINYYNDGTYANSDGGVLSYCCTTPLPSGGVGNITNQPLFVNSAAGNFRLQANSPCINSGDNSFVFTSTDLDGNPRISGGTVDMGVYEFQNPPSVISYAWLQSYGLPTDGSADFIDSDHDGMNNWQEWVAGTDPTNPLSVLKLLNPATGPTGLTISWLSVTNRTYYLQRSSNLVAEPAFITLQSGLAGQFGTNTYIDASATNGGPYFYRVGVQ